MIKGITIFSINLYQAFLSPTIKMVLGVGSVCRFDETCSAYTKRMIIEKGVIKGTGKGLVRLSKCQPLTS
jgi:putative component of membrane protein insertase Oxa1/YidC/SpoIIIJ protein YidD